MVDTNYAHAVKSLWRGVCTAYVSEGVTNKETGRAEVSERIIFADEPCRISFATNGVSELSDGAHRVKETVVLYIAAECDIPEGSRLAVSQNGVTRVYAQSGKPSVYSVHKEIPLELVGGWT